MLIVWVVFVDTMCGIPKVYSLKLGCGVNIGYICIFICFYMLLLLIAPT